MAVVSDAGFSRKANSANFPLWRFEDLRAQGIVLTWTTLNKWIDERGFPPASAPGPQPRCWLARQTAQDLHPTLSPSSVAGGSGRPMKRDGLYVRGESHPQAILTEAQVKLIRKSTEPLRDLGRRFGVSVGTVFRAKHAINSGHVTR